MLSVERLEDRLVSRRVRKQDRRDHEQRFTQIWGTAHGGVAASAFVRTGLIGHWVYTGERNQRLLARETSDIADLRRELRFCGFADNAAPAGCWVPKIYSNRRVFLCCGHLWF